MEQEDYKKIQEIYKKRMVVSKLADATQLRAVKDFDQTSSYIIEDYVSRIIELHKQLEPFNQEILDFLESLKCDMGKEFSNISKFESILEDRALQLIHESYINEDGTEA